VMADHFWFRTILPTRPPEKATRLNYR
jgi:hypothetical protein